MNTSTKQLIESYQSSCNEIVETLFNAGLQAANDVSSKKDNRKSILKAVAEKTTEAAKKAIKGAFIPKIVKALRDKCEEAILRWQPHY